MNTQESKDVVMAFSRMAFAEGRAAEAADRYLTEDYRQHNPQASDGRAAFVEVLESIAQQMPEAEFLVKRVIAEDDLVVVHYHLVPAPGQAGMAVVDIFRVDGDRIVEHWDVVQPVPEGAANGNTMF